MQEDGVERVTDLAGNTPHQSVAAVAVTAAKEMPMMSPLCAATDFPTRADALLRVCPVAPTERVGCVQCPVQAGGDHRQDHRVRE